MISIQSLKFDNADWELVEHTYDQFDWLVDSEQAYVTFHYFSKQPDIPCSLKDLAGLRNAYRQGVAAAGGGIVSMDVLQVKNLDCVQGVFKFKKQDAEFGMSYVAALTFPFAQFSYVIRIQAEEIGTTGIRDSIVGAMLMQSGDVEIDPTTHQMKGWFQDPYDPSFAGPLLKNKSEDETYDEKFPGHPLSRVRRLIANLKQRIEVSDELLAAKKFTG